MRTTFWITQIRNIGKTLNRPYTTINGWLLCAIQLGILGRYEMMQEGRPCRLNSKQFAQLYADIKDGPNKCGFESNVWTCRIIVIHVKKKFGIQYTERGMYNLLDRLNFSYKKPRQKHPKSASRQAINKLKVNLMSLLRNTLTKTTRYLQKMNSIMYLAVLPNLVGTPKVNRLKQQLVCLKKEYVRLTYYLNLDSHTNSTTRQTVRLFVITLHTYTKNRKICNVF